MVTEKHILGLVDRMPGLPTTITKIVELANNLGSSPRDLIQAIKFDPVLTAKVLKLINSAYFGLPAKVTSLTRAVIMLGINTLKNLALSSSVMSAISLKKNIPDFNVDRFWEHSLGCAVAAKILAKKMKVEKNLYEEYFIAGLMHDIGKILLVQYVTKDYELVLHACKENHTSQLIEEQNILGIDHPRVGALIAKKWELAEELIESIAQHHSVSPEGELTLAITVADTYCNLSGFGINLFGKTDIYAGNTLESIGISGEELEELFSSLPEEIDKAKIFLGK